MNLKIFLDQAKYYYKGRKAAYTSEEFLMLQVGYPLVTLIFYCLVASYSFHTEELGRWVISNSFLLCTNSCIFGIGQVFIGERFFGRLRSIIVSPCNKLMLILANGIGPMIVAFISAIIGLFVGLFCFGELYSLKDLAVAVGCILCSMFSATCFGLFLSIWGLVTDGMHFVLNMVSLLLLLFTGAEFSVDFFPEWIRWVSNIFPLTRGIQAIEMYFSGNAIECRNLLCYEMLVGVVYLLLARVIYGFIEKVEQVRGNFDLY